MFFRKDNSALDAASKGAMLGLEMVLGIIANLIAFISVVTFINSIIGWLGQLVGYEEDQLITLEVRIIKRNNFLIAIKIYTNFFL